MRFALLATALLATSAGAAAAEAPLTQPANERAVQKTLPMSRAPLWTTLAHTRIGEDDKHGVFTAAFPAEVKALEGRNVTLSGFMLPLDASEASRHFLLARYTPVCFFCPPGRPNEVVEVSSTRGVPVSSRMISVTGKLALENNGEKGLFFQVRQAAVH